MGRSIGKIQFVDGQNKVIYETEVRHGQYVEEPIGVVPTKNKDQLYVYRFSGWNFDFANTMILGPLNNCKL